MVLPSHNRVRCQNVLKNVLKSYVHKFFQLFYILVCATLYTRKKLYKVLIWD